MREQTAKIFFITVGWLSVGLGVIGIVLPLLPTTPFILLAAFCFARSSEKFHNLLLQHKYFGPIIKTWNEGRGIPRKTRNLILGMCWFSLCFSMWIIGQWWAVMLLASIGIGISICITR